MQLARTSSASEDIAEKLLARAAFREVEEVAFALPFTFEHADHLQIITDIATRLGPALGGRPSRESRGSRVRGLTRLHDSVRKARTVEQSCESSAEAESDDRAIGDKVPSPPLRRRVGSLLDNAYGPGQTYSHVTRATTVRGKHVHRAPHYAVDDGYAHYRPGRRFE